MLKAWSNIDIEKLVNEKINTPANGIFLRIDLQEAFGRYNFFLDKDKVLVCYRHRGIELLTNSYEFPNDPHRYGIEKTIPGGSVLPEQKDAVFHSSEEDVNGTEPPCAEFIKIHAAVARVLVISGIDYLVDTEYAGRVWE